MCGNPEHLKWGKGAAAAHIIAPFVGFKTRCWGFIVYHYTDDLKGISDIYTDETVVYSNITPELALIKQWAKRDSFV